MSNSPKVITACKNSSLFQWHFWNVLCVCIFLFFFFYLNGVSAMVSFLSSALEYLWPRQIRFYLPWIWLNACIVYNTFHLHYQVILIYLAICSFCVCHQPKKGNIQYLIVVMINNNIYISSNKKNFYLPFMLEGSQIVIKSGCRWKTKRKKQKQTPPKRQRRQHIHMKLKAATLCDSSTMNGQKNGLKQWEHPLF